MATPKQIAYLKSLMIDLGHAHPQYGPRSASKAYTTMRQRSAGGWDAFFAGMTVRRASELIDRLKSLKK